MLVKQAVVISLIACTSAWAQDPATQYAKPEELDWRPMDEGSSAEIAQLWGDMSTGPAAVMIRLKPGFSSGTHAHNSDYHAVVIRGLHTHWDKGQDPDTVVALKPGDGWYQPAHAFHSDANLASEPVIIFAYFEGAVDSYVSD